MKSTIIVAVVLLVFIYCILNAVDPVAAEKMVRVAVR